MKPILQAWLTRQCESGASGSRGTLWVRKGADAPPELASSHPPAGSAAAPDPERHRSAAEAALSAERAVVHSGDEMDWLAAPGICAGRPVAAVVEQPGSSPREQAIALDGLGRALGWLDWMLRAEAPAAPTAPAAVPGSTSAAQTAERSGAAAPSSVSAGPGADRTVELLAVALEPRPTAATTLALTTELASQLGCERVSLGRFDGGDLVLDAISHTAQPEPRSKLARQLVAAMQEAIDQDAVVVHPAPEGETPMAAAAARDLADEQDLQELWVFPLRDDDELTGAMLVEFVPGQKAPGEWRAWLEQLGSLVGPVLGLRRRDQASFGERVRILLREDLADAIGLDQLVVRVAIAGLTLLLAGLALLPGTHRVAAPAELEGIVQRAIVAPMPAFVAESRLRAGDLVEKGDVLGVLEDADLRLEARKWQAKREQRRKELRAAMANRDRSQLRILQAQVEQAEAELELIAEQRQRTRMVAPFDGVITHGDLSQSLGSPVERGEVLFEVAPRDDYRVILEVEGGDIAFVEAGQRGRLTLQALPGEARPFTIHRVTPISTAESGRSFFRVEAALEGERTGLRPGMDGVAKIDVGRRSLLWLWTHSALDWLRLAWWAWVP